MKNILSAITDIVNGKMSIADNAGEGTKHWIRENLNDNYSEDYKIREGEPDEAEI